MMSYAQYLQIIVFGLWLSSHWSLFKFSTPLFGFQIRS